MKPIILYESNETTFTTNGLGTLDEAISAEITEELNGIFELSFTYPITGSKFSEIRHSRIVKCISSPSGTYQLFRIYSISKVIRGTITVNAEHISYQLSYIPVDAFTATSAVDAMAKLSANAMSTCPFTFWTDKQTVANYKQEAPDNIRARLAGVSGSILDVYGGEYEFDNYDVKLHNHRGQDRNVTLRYGKNITDIEQEENIASTYTSIVGYWKNEGELVKTDVIDSQYANSYPYKRVKVVDFSDEYEEAPTVAQLTSRATSYMTSNNFGIPSVSIKVSFVALWQTEEYKDVAVLERVYLGDTVSVFYEKLGITASAKVVKTTYNVLLDRYNSIELGKLRSNLSSKLATQEVEIREEIDDTKSALEKAVEKATELIRGGLGGHVVLNTDADGKPQEILIMDTEDISTATKVWRWNLGGLGYSNTGYEGNFGTAITMNGAIVADYITAGTMQANRVRAGLLEDETGTNYWNLDTGQLSISSNATIGGESFQSIIDGIQNQIDGSITSWFYNYAPTTSNAPASTWTTVNDKIAHVGDLFYNSDTGYCYRWQVKEDAVDPAHPTANEFEWVQISDEDIAAAMSAASTAQDTADSKRRVFVKTPTPPYDIGDLWAQGSNGDLLRCKKARTSSQSYSSSDWIKASKYTDDSALSAFIQNTYNSDKQVLEGQIDQKAETWYQSSDPSSEWATDEAKSEHVGDLWYKTTDKTTWYYEATTTGGTTTYSWKQQNVPDEVFDKIDGKAQVFISQPTTPYFVGDLWFVGASGDVLTCITPKTQSQSYSASDWEKRNKYVDEIDIYANYVGADPTSISDTWTTIILKDSHLGDVYYNTTDGEYYRWTLTGTTYSWNVIDVSNGVFSIVSSKFRVTDDAIVSEVKRATKAENEIFANYKGNYIPSDSNSPEEDWLTDAEKDNHVGQVFLNTNTDTYYVYKHNTANSVQLTLDVQTESTNYDYVQIWVKTGENEYHYTNKYGGTTRTTYNITVPAPIDNQVLVYWHTDSSKHGYYGFRAYDFKLAYIDPLTHDANNTASSFPSVDSTTYSTNPASAHNPYADNENKKFIRSITITDFYHWEEIDTTDGNYSVVASQIKQTADQILLKVSKGDVSSQLSVETGQIRLATGRLIINSGNFQIDANGNINASNAQLEGTVTSGNILDGNYAQLSSGILSFELDGVNAGSIEAGIGRGNTSLKINTGHLYLYANSILVEDPYGDTPLYGQTISDDVIITDINGTDHVCRVVNGLICTL